MKVGKVLLLGGSGFIGYSVAEQLARQGLFVTVPTRHLARARHLLPLPTVDLVEADVNDPGQLDGLMQGQDAVINLIGILHGDFERAHVTLPAQVAAACIANHVPRLVHMSALNADVDGPSEYLRSRGRGEAKIAEAVRQNPALKVTVFRPSVVFGERDHFLNMFAALVRWSPFIPLGSPEARFQPVWVEDVARAVVTSLDLTETRGKTYPLVGPDVYTLRQLLETVMELTGVRRPVIGLGAMLSALQATVFEWLPGKLITRDNVRSMSIASTSSESFPAIFGSPASLIRVAAGYLRKRAAGPSGRARYDRFRGAAGRS